MNLADHIDKIAKVAEVAGKEFSIEQALDKMEKEWEPIQFEVSKLMYCTTYFTQGKFGNCLRLNLLMRDTLIVMSLWRGSKINKFPEIF